MRLPPSLLFVLLCSSTVPLARGHIGQTVEQCRQQYGEPCQVRVDILTYKIENYSLIVTFFADRADALVYRKAQTDDTGSPEEMSAAEMDQLLQINAGGRTWKKSASGSLDPTWETEDGELSARYASAKHYLAILTKGYAARAEAAEQAGNSFGLKTF